MLRTARSAGAALVAAALLPTAPAVAAIHTVAPGETLWGIAIANQLPTSAVAAANGLSPEARILAGANLTIPAPGTTGPVAAAAGTSGVSGGGALQVRWGDTLSAIAARNGVS